MNIQMFTQETLGAWTPRLAELDDQNVTDNITESLFVYVMVTVCIRANLLIRNVRMTFSPLNATRTLRFQPQSPLAAYLPLRYALDHNPHRTSRSTAGGTA